MFQNIRTAVIGTGSMGKNHARIYSEISNLVAIVDTVKETGLAISEKYGVEFFQDYKELIGKVDAVTIAVPTKFHFYIAMDLVNAGVNVLVEKPMASNVDEAKKIIAAASKSNVILSVGHIERHNPVVEYAKKNILDGSWGDIISISAKRFSPNPVRISDVGVILDLSVHDIDVINYLFGVPPKSIYCSGSSYSKTDNEDHVLIILNYGDGKIGICETSWQSPIKIRQLSVTSPTNYAELDFMSQSIDLSKSNFSNLSEKNLFKSTMEINNQKINIPNEEPLKNQLIDFLTSVENSTEPLVTGSDGLSVLKVATAALESLKYNKLIEL